MFFFCYYKCLTKKTKIKNMVAHSSFSDGNNNKTIVWDFEVLNGYQIMYFTKSPHSTLKALYNQ